jgi:hypothetical protein
MAPLPRGLPGLQRARIWRSCCWRQFPEAQPALSRERMTCEPRAGTGSASCRCDRTLPLRICFGSEVFAAWLGRPGRVDNGWPSYGGPRVRIRLPPAESQSLSRIRFGGREPGFPAAYFQYIIAPWRIPELFSSVPISGVLNGFSLSMRATAFFLLLTPAANGWFKQ